MKALNKSFNKIENLYNSEVAKFCNAYVSETTSSIDEIKALVGKKFCHNDEDDLDKFLEALCKMDLVLTKN